MKEIYYIGDKMKQTEGSILAYYLTNISNLLKYTKRINTHNNIFLSYWTKYE
jgi:hypothetical protein